MILCKSSVLLDDEHYSQILNLSWELLLDRNEELAACAGMKLNRYVWFRSKACFLLILIATIVILTAARAGQLVDALFHSEMENSSALIRYNAILKFQTLWRFRYQFWIRLEEGAHSMMKVKHLEIKEISEEIHSNTSDSSTKHWICSTITCTRCCKPSNSWSTMDATRQDTRSTSRSKSRRSGMYSTIENCFSTGRLCLTF